MAWWEPVLVSRESEQNYLDVFCVSIYPGDLCANVFVPPVYMGTPWVFFLALHSWHFP